MTGSKRSKIIGMALAAPAALGGAWTIKRLMTSSDGALAHEEPEDGKHEKARDALKKTGHGSSFQPGAMGEPMKREAGISKDEAKAKLQEVKSTVAEGVGQMKEQAMGTGEDVARQAGAAVNTARETAMSAAPGIFSWMRRNTKAVMGIGMSAFALIGLMRWRRRRKVA